jgi:hypothetical protein
MESIGCIQDCFLVREVQGGNQAAGVPFVSASRSVAVRSDSISTKPISSVHNIDGCSTATLLVL